MIFSITAVQFCKYEKLVSGDGPGIRLKYVGVFALIVALIAGIGVFFWSSYRSSYEVSNTAAGYVVHAEKLNTSVVKEYDLKKGDIVVFHITEFERGHVYLSITASGNDPIFLVDSYNLGYQTFEIESDGHYRIEISGEKMTGIVEVTIK